MGRLTGCAPLWCNYFIGDAHIYESHGDQLTRTLFAAPQLQLSDRMPDFAETGRYEREWRENVEPSNFALVGHETPCVNPPLFERLYPTMRLLRRLRNLHCA